MNYADIRKYDIANGKGIGSTLFFSGCSYHCEGCFNKEAWNFSYGNLYTKDVEDKFIGYLKDTHISHASLLGGEVFQQDLDVILNLVKRIKDETNKSIWIWTGGLFEELKKNKDKLNILEYVDVLVDGRFELDKRDLNLKYKGSSNQRVIDIPKSLKLNRVIEYD